MEASNALKRAIAKPGFKFLLILMPGDGGVNGEQLGLPPPHRADFIENLTTAPGGEKVFVFERFDRYVHSKIYIIDDKFAIIGSANCNRRGWEQDSEVVAGIYEESSDEQEAGISLAVSVSGYGLTI